ncbi:aspartyl-phosphate phosphatase Spo0E family protein [Bacillus tequilensis]|uniref:aspartyl-phosphate phosphatase Spo0E family protein n=1 Tax=Bacillus tequilensis TaxID=227866 RepID=UPI001576609E|nr:aspartyl-phosphate phosphatase Spo0E family protein [Bacillus tequilensis]NTU26831.1 aspartyl-phosphate phosphatase Spo0E family protein [Bacillus tequilensis]
MDSKIEEMRTTLIETAQKYGMNSEETIQCSQALDSLLNSRIKEGIGMIFGGYAENSRM